MSEETIFSLHELTDTELLFASNVIVSAIAYLTVFVEAFMMPF